jgi:hypothetical protein
VIEVTLYSPDVEERYKPGGLEVVSRESGERLMEEVRSPVMV